MAGNGQLAQLCHRHSIVLITVFGSVLDDNRTPRDLDIAVMFEFTAVPDMFAVVDELMDVTDVASIDVMELNRAGVVARDQALALSEPLYEAEKGLYASQQIAAALRRMDTDWLRRLDLELMAAGRRP
ncbi:MAG TPA: nucleotidyltransferase domain-containing protein [Mycobacteriales bacterium]|jgi:predicted nucleotidyltransferase|nr:nucleotidyltransferase domain-containing protein [Mycobacteriales bacterium]